MAPDTVAAVAACCNPQEPVCAPPEAGLSVGPGICAQHIMVGTPSEFHTVPLLLPSLE